MFKLILKFQDAVLEEFTFEGTPVSIGRRNKNDIVIDNMAVSGNHSVITAQDPNHYVVVDQDSLNGTFLNEKKVTREMLYDGDVIRIGKHDLLFQDLRPKESRPERPSTEEHAIGGGEFRETVILDTDAQKELLAKQGRQSNEDAPPKPKKKIEIYGSLTILSGGTPEIIDLTKRLTVLGKSANADVKCSGLLVGKTAAVLEKRPQGFFIGKAQGMKKPEVNGEAITGRVQLHDGDEISIGNTRMTFNQREEISEGP